MGGGKARVRGVRLYAVPVGDDGVTAVSPAVDASVSAQRIDVKGEALQVFRSLAESVFKSLTDKSAVPAAAAAGAFQIAGLVLLAVRSCVALGVCPASCTVSQCGTIHPWTYSVVPRSCSRR